MHVLTLPCEILMSENLWQSETDVINYELYGSVAIHLMRFSMITLLKFTAKFTSEKN